MSKRSKRAGDNVPPPTAPRAPSPRARVFGREKTWSASTAAAIKRCCCRFSVSVCGIYADASSSRSSSSNRRRFGDLLHSISSHFFSPLSICLDVDNIHVTSRTPACADALWFFIFFLLFFFSSKICNEIKATINQSSIH